jgi:DNA topoisomerase-3
MGYKLLIAEKYSNALPFANHLGIVERRTQMHKGNCGWIVCKDNWIVTWEAGHILAQAMPDDYDPKYKRWNLADLPIVPSVWKQKPMTTDPARSQLRAIKQILADYEIDAIYNAADDDREGELLAREVIEYLGVGNLLKYRLRYITTTEESISSALANPLPATDYDNIYRAALLRQRIDWIYGLNMTRAYTAWSHATQNIGRVVSPTIGLVVDRQVQIDSFVPKDYVSLTATVDIEGKGLLDLSCRVDDVAAGEALAKSLKGKIATVKSAETSHKSERRRLFTLTDLQSACSTLFGFEADKTSKIAQALYDAGNMSYPRTNAETINPDQVPGTVPILDSAAAMFGAPKQSVDVQRLVRSADDKVAEASHTGLLPTLQGLKQMGRLDSDQRNVLSLVSIVALAAALPANEWDATKITADLAGYEWTATGRVETVDGFKSFLKRETDKLRTKKARSASKKQARIPEHTAPGDSGPVVESSHAKKKTEPPKQYTTAELLDTMKNIWRYLTDKAQRDAMRLSGAGLGTQSSRDTVLKTMQSSGFVTKKSGRLYPTEKAVKLMSLLPPLLKSPGMTANLEMELTDVALGKKDGSELMESFLSLVSGEIERVKGYEPVADTERVHAQGKLFCARGCPKCNGDVYDVGKLYVCDKSCGWKMWKSVAKKKLLVKEAKAIISEGRTAEKVDGLKSKKGSEFSCWLVADKEKGVVFDFSESRPPAPAWFEKPEDKR